MWMFSRWATGQMKPTLKDFTSVPDPDPWEMYIFWPLGFRFGSVIICTDPDPFINKQKINRTVISAVL